MAEPARSRFESTTQHASRDNFVTDCWHFLRSNKKWWLLPLMLICVLFGGLMVLSSTAAAPFIYTLF
jgi:hypothetical protein